MRFILAVAACTTISCSYPEFDFVPDDATALDDSAAIDDAIADSGAHTDGALDSSSDASSDASSDSLGDSSFIDADTSDTGTASDSAASDARVSDTAVLVDSIAPRDTAAETDASKTGFCLAASPTHAFCNDFDASSTALFGWSSDNLLGVGSYTLDGTALSSPNALHTVFTASSATTSSSASVNRVIDAPLADSLTRFEADVRLDSATYEGDGTLLLKVQRTGGNGIGFGIDSGGFYMEMVGTAYTYTRVTATPTAGTWFHVRIEGKLLVVGGSAKVWIDSALVADVSGKSTARDEGTTRTFVVGLYADPALPAFGARFDNVTVDFF